MLERHVEPRVGGTAATPAGLDGEPLAPLHEPGGYLDAAAVGRLRDGRAPPARENREVPVAAASIEAGSEIAAPRSGEPASRDRRAAASVVDATGCGGVRRTRCCTQQRPRR